MAEKKPKEKKPKKKRPEKKSKPSFSVPNAGFKKRVKKRWRKPRGTHNKKRMKCAFMGAHPRIGYKNAESVRGLRCDGFREVLVSNKGEIEAIKEKDVILVIGSSVGTRKRKMLLEAAKVQGLKIANFAEKKGE